MNAKSRWFQTFALQEGGIRWRVPELTPNTPGPAASADYVYVHVYVHCIL